MLLAAMLLVPGVGPLPGSVCGPSAAGGAALAHHLAARWCVHPRARALLLVGAGDPVRAGKRAPIEPLAINAIVAGLTLAAGADAAVLVDELVAKRARDPDAALLADEERVLRAWVAGALGRQDTYRAALGELARSEPWLESELGVGADSNPYVMLCRAECMLALFLLRDADADARRTVAFIDADRLEVLSRVAA
ncbi:hypothetical protein KFE25_014097 [Diacronema lutheri]|uniref:Uncharacterized protein n=1 Tax=Diacronema lutheri TaxID=2081491 RepID=A0A8J5X9S9_DIALT|nr:hypothetical protein KFE25_014097 [Diacronema lutheri]